MPFRDSLDIANRALQHCGLTPILSVTEDSQRNTECAAAYDKVRRAELRRNTWGFAVKRAALRPLTTTTLTLVPGAYDASKTYLPGEVVQDTNGLMWTSEQADNLNNTPGGNNSAWEMYFGPMTADVYASTQTYFSGELVYVLTGTTPNGYQVYLSLISGNADVPGTATAYDATVQYKQDDVVASGGFQWRSLLPVNKANTPAVGPNAWVSGTAYTIGQQVTASNSYIYTALGSTTGNDPTTDAGAHWASTGTLNAWSKSPTLVASSVNWRPLIATLKNIITVYPLGTGPASQTTTRNVYRLPAGYLRKAVQYPPGPFNSLGGPTGIGFEDWEFNGNFIVSADASPIMFRFVADITKVADVMDDMFCEALACSIAIAVCPRLTQSDGKLQTIASEYKLRMSEARTVNAIEQGAIDQPDDLYLQVRL